MLNSSFWSGSKIWFCWAGRFSGQLFDNSERVVSQLGMQTQNMLQGLHIPSGLGVLWEPPGRAAGCGWAEGPLGYFAFPTATEMWIQIRGSKRKHGWSSEFCKCPLSKFRLWDTPCHNDLPLCQSSPLGEHIVLDRKRHNGPIFSTVVWQLCQPDLNTTGMLCGWCEPFLERDNFRPSNTWRPSQCKFMQRIWKCKNINIKSNVSPFSFFLTCSH